MNISRYWPYALLVSVVFGIIIAIGYATWLLIHTWPILIVSMIMLWAVWWRLSRQAWWYRWVWWYLCIWAIGCSIEMIGILTCWPYGCFTYSDLLWPKFFWTFPLLLIGIRPFIVLSMAHLIPKTRLHLIQQLIRWVCLLLILDLALDPVHVVQWIRSYTPTSRMRFGVPAQNYLGRILTWSISLLIYILNKKHLTHPARYLCGVALMMIFWVQFLWYYLF